MAAETRTVADAAVAALAGAGIRVCFANPGTTEMWTVAALEKHQSIKSVLCLHEAVATGACDGYARILRSPALALLHLGPGLGNGLCNLHNARRAGSPVLMLVGDMATWHRAADPPLSQDIEALAATVSGRVLTVTSPAGAAATMREALAATQPPAWRTACGSGAAARPSAGCAGSRVVTVLLPHDISWAPAEPEQGQSTALLMVADVAAQPPSLADSHAAAAFIRDCAAALRAAPRGKAALYLGGQALLAEGGALACAGRIAAALGATLLCEPLPAHISRGAGLPHARRLQYFPQEAAAELRRYEVLLLLDAKRPVASFGYKDGPSALVQLPDDRVWELDASWCVAEALQLLEAEIPGAAPVRAGVNCGGVFAPPQPARPPLPTGALTPQALCQVVAALQPADCIIVDESLTSGTAYWEASKGCPAFSQCCLTGGAIGMGPPLATGAAVAAGHGRRVINLQADGSGMYTLQALWTQAQQQLRVLTVVCANNRYAILQVEAVRQRTGSNALTSLAGPALDWVALAQGMGVPGGRADTAEQLAGLVAQGLSQEGPFVIHAALA